MNRLNQAMRYPLCGEKMDQAFTPAPSAHA
jgi:hypothetical protein